MRWHTCAALSGPVVSREGAASTGRGLKNLHSSDIALLAHAATPATSRHPCCHPPTHPCALPPRRFGLPPAHYDKWPALRDNFIMVSTSKDRNGVEYVSTAEHKHYPFFATQVCVAGAWRGARVLRCMISGRGQGAERARGQPA